MNYEGPVIVGIGSLSAFLLAADVIGFAPIPAPVPLAAGLGMAALGSIAADIDHPRSLISSTIPARLFKLGTRLLFIMSLPAIVTIASARRLKLVEPERLIQQDIFRLLLVVTLGALGLFVISRVIHKSINHRGPIHAPIFFVGVTMVTTIFLAFYVPNWWWMGLTFGWGWFSHIAADGLTPMGIPLFWPLSDEKKHLLPDFLLAITRFFIVILSMTSIILLVARLTKII
jgi:membrane-bound metal-dependent hydrolase YbcI (DUF457 family)